MTSIKSKIKNLVKDATHYSILKTKTFIKQRINMKLKLAILCLLISFTTFQSFGQNTGGALLLTVNYGNQYPQKDMFTRFGNNLTVGLNLEYLTDKQNLIFGVQSSLLFGNIVKEDVLAPLRNNNNLIYNNTFSTATVDLRERGNYSGVYLGKLFGLLKENKRSGIRVQLGVGLLQHKIRIQTDANSFVAELTKERLKGYDRLTNGLALQQFIGYQHHSKNRLVNFYAGFEFIQGFTQNRRSINVDTGITDTSERLDLLVGFKLGWTLPFYIGGKPDTIYY